MYRKARVYWKRGIGCVDKGLQEVLTALVHTEAQPVPYCAVGVYKHGQILYRAGAGLRFPNAEKNLENSFGPEHLVRVASVSKPFVALACMQAVRLGLLDFDADVSRYLGFTLRHPRYPNNPITSRMLLSHTSSLRDGSVYSIPSGHDIRNFFLPGSDYWKGGEHFANVIPGYRETHFTPGRFFEYCNLGFGVMGTVLERVTGMRFDVLLEEWVLKPLGMTGSFNPGRLDTATRSRLTPAYRMDTATRSWVPQVDHDPLAILSSTLPAHTPGINATVFSPQGGLRASIDDLLCFIAYMTAKEHADVRNMLMTPQWTFDPARCEGKPNGRLYNGISRLSGLGLFRTTDSFDTFGGNRIGPKSGGPRLWGHYGDAYGVLSGVLFDPRTRYGFCYVIGGSSADPDTYTGSHSSFSRWEEQIQDAIIAAFPPE